MANPDQSVALTNLVLFGVFAVRADPPLVFVVGAMMPYPCPSPTALHRPPV